MLNPFFLLLPPPLVSPLLSFRPPTGLGSTSLLHLHFPYFSHSITPFPPISISVLLPSPACLPRAWAFRSVCHWKFRHAAVIFFFWSCCFVVIRLSSLSHPFLFLPFHQPRPSPPQHHCWSWLSAASRQNVTSLPLLLLPPLPILTLFHLTWLFTHWCSDAKVTNSQQNAVCFSWCALEILQEETFFMVCVQLVFDSARSQGPPVQENLNRNMEICLHFFLKVQTSKDVAESFQQGRSLFC